MGIIRFALKSSLAGGIVYYTVQEGLWSKPEETVKLYGRMYNTVAPYIKKNIPGDIVKEIPDLPSVSTMTNCAKGTWNTGVTASIKFISDLPTHASNGFDYLKSLVVPQDSVPSVKGLYPAQSESGKTQ